MRLISFHPDPYRNLLPRTIRFVQPSGNTSRKDIGCSIRFLVGRNGSGKTNLLRFITSIFLALYENYRRPHAESPAYFIPFHLLYELHGNTIDINSTGEGRSGLTITIDGYSYTPGEIPALDSILPTALLVYSSGDQDDWCKLFLPFPEETDENKGEPDLTERRPEEEYPPNRKHTVQVDTPTRLGDLDNVTLADLDAYSLGDLDYRKSDARIFLAQPQHLKLALLAALIDYQYKHPDKSAFDDVLAEVPVRLIAFSFHVDIKDKSISPTQRRFLSRMFDLTTLPLSYWQEQQWVYDLAQRDKESGKSTLERLVDNPLKDPFQIFQVMASLQDNGVIHSVNLIVKYSQPGKSQNASRILLADNLSDGELAFLSRMALIYLLNEPECLFLLDEPEVHFNDDWKRNLVDSIERALTIPQKTESEVILTSHASIVLTDAYPDEVILMTDAGQIDNVPLTFASEQGEVLRYLFDSDRSVGRRAMRVVEEVIKNGSIQDLEALLEQVGPGYYRFKIVKELQSRVPPIEQDNLSSTG